MTRANRRRHVSGPNKGERLPQEKPERFIDGIDTDKLEINGDNVPCIEFSDYLEQSGEYAVYKIVLDLFGITESTEAGSTESKPNLHPNITDAYLGSLIAAGAGFSLQLTPTLRSDLQEAHIASLDAAATMQPDPVQFLRKLAVYTEGQRTKILEDVEKGKGTMPADAGAFFAQTSARFVMPDQQ